MHTRINKKGSFHFTYTAGYPIDPNDRVGSVVKARTQIRVDAELHYDKMFPSKIACVVIEDPIRVLVEPTTILTHNTTRAGFVILEVDIGVFFDYVATPFPEGPK